MGLSLPFTPRYTQLGSRGPSPSAAGGDGVPLPLNDPLATYAVAATIAFTVFVYLFETYLTLRQRSTYCRKEFPRELKATVGSMDAERAKRGEEEEKKDEGGDDKKDDSKAGGGAEKVEGNSDVDDEKSRVDRNAPLLPQLQAKFDAAQLYGMDKVNFSLFSSTYGTIEGVTFVLLGFLPYVWDLSCDAGSRFGWTESNNEIKISLVFLAIIVVFGTITSLPFDLYSTFQIERKHGFNKQTIGLFFTDKVKGILLTAAIGGPFMALLLKIILSMGERFYLYVWAFAFVFSAFMMTIVPVVIMPIFNKYEKLPEGRLKDEIYALAGRLEFPLTKLFVMDGSKRSSHSNAFMFGFFKNKRIVLYDTLMNQVHNDEILAILGHELGHWKMGHTVTNFVITQLYTGLTFYAFSLCYNSHGLYRAFGFDDESRPVPTIIALYLFLSTVFGPVDKALNYAMTVHSRKCEFEADEFSHGLGMGKKLQSGLCKIHLENLGAMCPDPWYSTYHYSHPPLVERLSAMMELDKKLK